MCVFVSCKSSKNKKNDSSQGESTSTIDASKSEQSITTASNSVDYPNKTTDVSSDTALTTDVSSVSISNENQNSIQFNNNETTLSPAETKQNQTSETSTTTDENVTTSNANLLEEDYFI